MLPLTFKEPLSSSASDQALLSPCSFAFSLPINTMPISPAERRASLFQLHLAVLLAGGTGLFPKIVAASPVVVTCGRTIFGSLALALGLCFLKSSFRLHSWRNGMWLALTGGVMALHWVCFFRSIQVSSVAVGLLAFSTLPLFVTFLEPLVFKERLHGYDIITAAVVVAGLVLVTPTWDVENHITQGVIWGVLAAFTCAVFSLMGRSSLRRNPALTVAFYQQMFAALWTLPFALAWQGTLTGRDVAFLFALGTIFTALAQWLTLSSMRHFRAQAVSVASGLEPVYSILLAWWLLGEKPATRTLYGGLLILSAVLWSSLKHRQEVADHKCLT